MFSELSLTEQSKLFKTTVTTLHPRLHASHGEVLAKGQPGDTDLGETS